MQQESARKILAASFTTPDGGSRAAGALGGSMRDRIGNTAVLFVRPDGKAKFIESKDWGAGRGALLGGAIGIILPTEPWVGFLVATLLIGGAVLESLFSHHDRQPGAIGEPAVR